MDAKTFASFGRKLAAAGANMLGGCCGTTPAHIQKLAQCNHRQQTNITCEKINQRVEFGARISALCRKSASFHSR